MIVASKEKKLLFVMLVVFAERRRITQVLHKLISKQNGYIIFGTTCKSLLGEDRHAAGYKIKQVHKF